MAIGIYLNGTTGLLLSTVTVSSTAERPSVRYEWLKIGSQTSYARHSKPQQREEPQCQ